ncbi:MAG: T9SS type A sorting domain-containing protein [Bacteroidota bacterium]
MKSLYQFSMTRIQKSKGKMLLIILGALLFQTTGNAATIFINSSTGNDLSGDGSAGLPYQSFHKAYSLAVSGDIIDATGTFTWTDATEVGDVSQTGYILDKNLTIRGKGRDFTFFQAASTRGVADRSVFFVSANRTITFENLTIRYGKVTAEKLGGGLTLAGSYCGNYPCSSITGTAILNYVNVVENDANGVTSNQFYMAGGVYLREASTITINHSNVSSNSCTCTLYSGGGIAGGEQSQSVTITNSTVASNSATSSFGSSYPYSYASVGGGMALQRFGRLVVTNSTFFGNSTNNYGGGINIWYQNWATFTNTTIANNTATLGAGGLLWGTPNQTAYDFYKLYIKNTLIANNTGNSISNDLYASDAFSGTMVNAVNSIVEYSSNATLSGTGMITGEQANLGLASELADNSSTTGTRTLSISSSSVALNAGNSTAHGYGAYTVTPPSTDQRTLTRDSQRDIGAFEFISALPVEMVYFEAICNEGDPILMWATASEHNSDHFIIETSTDGEHWDEAGKVPAAGNSTSEISYTFSVSSKSSSAIELFRLRQVDIDGVSKLYGPVSLDCDVEDEDRIYPNPVKDQFVLTTTSQKEDKVVYSLFNNQGHTVWSQEKELNSGQNSILFALPVLQPGIYYLKNSSSDHVSRIVIVQ